MKAFFIGGLLFCSAFLVCCSNPDRPYAKLEPPQTRKIPVHFQTAPNTCGPAAFHKGQLTVIDPAKGVKSVAPVDFRRNASSHLATRKSWQGYVLLLEPSSL